MNYEWHSWKEEGERVHHHTCISIRKLQCLAISSILMLVILVLFLLSHQQEVGLPECDALLSPSYSSNRSVSSVLCTVHSSEINPLFPPHTTTTNNNASSSFQFLVFGDFGLDGYCCQRDVAIEMNRAASSADFVINTGDSFYQYGLNHMSNDQFQTSFVDVYKNFQLDHLQRLPFYSVLGNHEYLGSVSAVLKLHESFQFHMESRYYDKTFTNSQGLVIHMVFLDTSPMIEAYRAGGKYASLDRMLRQRDGITTQWALVDQQLEFLNQSLFHAQHAHHRIVVGHHPIYSRTFPVNQITFLSQRIAPLLEKHKVVAYFSGHEHNLQHIHRRGVSYFVSGAGAQVFSSWGGDGGGFHLAEPGFMVVNCTKTHLSVFVVTMNSTVVRKIEVNGKL